MIQCIRKSLNVYILRHPWFNLPVHGLGYRSPLPLLVLYEKFFYTSYLTENFPVISQFTYNSSSRKQGPSTFLFRPYLFSLIKEPLCPPLVATSIRTFPPCRLSKTKKTSHFYHSKRTSRQLHVPSPCTFRYTFHYLSGFLFTICYNWVKFILILKISYLYKYLYMLKEFRIIRTTIIILLLSTT